MKKLLVIILVSLSGCSMLVPKENTQRAGIEGQTAIATQRSFETTETVKSKPLPRIHIVIPVDGVKGEKGNQGNLGGKGTTNVVERREIIIDIGSDEQTRTVTASSEQALSSKQRATNEVISSIPLFVKIIGLVVAVVAVFFVGRTALGWVCTQFPGVRTLIGLGQFKANKEIDALAADKKWEADRAISTELAGVEAQLQSATDPTTITRLMQQKASLEKIRGKVGAL